jgi:hypothetical protein
MNYKRFAPIVCLIAGVALMIFSMYIKGQVAGGRDQISSAQNTVDKTSSLFGSNAVSKQVGKGLLSGAQNKIDAGSAEADYYEAMAHWLQVGGIVLIAAGVGAYFYFRRKGL